MSILLVGGSLWGGFTPAAHAVASLPCGITAISAGDRHSLAVGPGGTVYSWGYGGNGRLGDGTTTSRPNPIQVPGLSGITAVAAGGSHSLALTAGGLVYAWGLNTYGQLGDGTPTTRYSPIQVPGLSKVAAIAAGGNTSFAMTTGGAVWAWGYNQWGQLGDGTSTTRRSPVKVHGLSKITAITSGQDTALAIGAGGTVYGWGFNESGEVGDGSTTDRHSPVQVPGLSGITAISNGGNHTLAIGAGGIVYGWGYNRYGSVGDGTIVDRHSPVQVPGLSAITRISAGQTHSLAIGPGGSVYMWGYNGFGQLGDDTTINRLVPMQGRAVGITAIDGGTQHSLAVGVGGTVTAWGGNTYGQLGDGTTNQRLSFINLNEGCIQFNDGFTSTTWIFATPYETVQSTSGATLEPGELAPCAVSGATVWFSYTHPAWESSRHMFLDTFTSNYDSTVGVWTGSAIGAITLVACNDNARGTQQSETSWLASPGSTYRIQVAAIGGNTGTLRLHLRTGALLALGDSIVAGHGLGPSTDGFPDNPGRAHPAVTGATVGLDVYNLARSGDCASSSTYYGGHAWTPASCDGGNIMQNQLDALPVMESPPTHVVIGVGGNDIEFSACIEGFIENDADTMGLCEGDKLNERLTAIAANVDAVISRVQGLFSPTPHISLVGYYNPFPSWPNPLFPDDVCDMWMPAAMARFLPMAAMDHSSAEFRTLVMPTQASAYSYATDVVTRLNDTLRSVAGTRATFVETAPEFVGHDMCAQIRGGTAEDTWVYGPMWHDSSSGPLLPNRSYTSRGMPNACGYTQGEPVIPPKEFQSWFEGAIFDYRMDFATNCMPHPTEDGQRAIADLVGPTLVMP